MASKKLGKKKATRKVARKPARKAARKPAKKAARKAPARKAASRKTARKPAKAAARKAAAKKPAARKPPAKKSAPAARKPAARRPAPRRPAVEVPRRRESTEDSAFMRKGRTQDDLAEELGESFVQSATSGEDATMDVQNEETDEEQGGPFVETSAAEEFADDVDESNPEDAEPAALPTTSSDTESEE